MCARMMSFATCSHWDRWSTQSSQCCHLVLTHFCHFLSPHESFLNVFRCFFFSNPFVISFFNVFLHVFCVWFDFMSKPTQPTQLTRPTPTRPTYPIHPIHPVHPTTPSPPRITPLFHPTPFTTHTLPLLTAPPHTTPRHHTYHTTHHFSQTSCNRSAGHAHTRLHARTTRRCAT